MAEIKDYAVQVGQALVDMAQRVRPTDQVDEKDNGKIWHYRALAVFIEIIDHGIEHRTNITTILAQQGIRPPDLDGWEYMRLNPDRMGA